MLKRSLIVCSGLVFALAAGGASAQEWTRFRGPNGSGVSACKTLPSAWSDADYLWRIDLPGTGNSSPVVWGERLFTATADDATGTRMLLCVSTVDGQVLWTREFPSITHKKHQQNTYASCTPAVDAERVYFCWGTPNDYTFVAFDHEGREIWRRDLGAYGGGHGSGTSPIVFEDMVVLANDREKDGYLIALDARSGDVRWKIDRAETRTPYATPCVYQPNGRPPLLIFTDFGNGITAIDPYQGAVEWQINTFYDESEERRSIGSPQIAGDLVLGQCGFVSGKRFIVAVRPMNGDLSSGDVKAEEVYRIDRNVPQVPTTLVKDGLLYIWTDTGIVTCADVTTGKTVWQKRVGGDFAGSPIAAGDKLYAVSLNGEVVVLAASREYKELGRVKLGDICRSTPAVANDTLFLRTQSKLFAIRGTSAP